MNEYKAIFEIYKGDKATKHLTRQKYTLNDEFQAESDDQAYTLAMSNAKEMAEFFYPNPINQRTTVKLTSLSNGNGRDITFNKLESIIQHSKKNDSYCDGKSKEYVSEH